MLLSLAGTSSTTLGMHMSHRSLSSSSVPSVLFQLQVPEGRCLALQFPNIHPDHHDSLMQVRSNDQHWLRDELHPLEIDYGLSETSASQQSFWMGRLAMHTLLGQRDSCILKDAYGRPLMPTGLYGSISHKGSTVVALVSETTRVGVDLEMTKSKRNIARKVLTSQEISDLGKLDVSCALVVLLDLILDLARAYQTKKKYCYVSA
jgi:4'-phosphopantetheinyl transferase EntD